MLREGDIGVEPAGNGGTSPAVVGGSPFQAEGEMNAEA